MATTVTEHGVRLENGTKVFDQLRKDINKVDARTTPTPPSVIKIVAITFSVFIAAAGALWGLAQMLRDRPTVDQVDRIIEQRDVGHEAAGHVDIRESIDSMKREQGAQRNVLDRAIKQQEEAASKLDELLKRVPQRRR